MEVPKDMTAPQPLEMDDYSLHEQQEHVEDQDLGDLDDFLPMDTVKEKGETELAGNNEQEIDSVNFADYVPTFKLEVLTAVSEL